jgi:hypothetical protein
MLLRAHADRRWSRLVALLPALGSRELLRRAAGCLLIVFGIRLGSYVPLADVDLLAMPEMQQWSALPKKAFTFDHTSCAHCMQPGHFISCVSARDTAARVRCPFPDVCHTLAFVVAKPA